MHGHDTELCGMVLMHVVFASICMLSRYYVVHVQCMSQTISKVLLCQRFRALLMKCWAYMNNQQGAALTAFWCFLDDMLGIVNAWIKQLPKCEEVCMAKVLLIPCTADCKQSHRSI